MWLETQLNNLWSARFANSVIKRKGIDGIALYLIGTFTNGYFLKELPRVLIRIDFLKSVTIKVVLLGVI